jgi:hypothetical protein
VVAVRINPRLLILSSNPLAIVCGSSGLRLDHWLHTGDNAIIA